MGLLAKLIKAFGCSLGDVVNVLRLPPGPQRIRAWKPVWGIESPCGIFLLFPGDLASLTVAAVRVGGGEADDGDADADADADAEAEAEMEGEGEMADNTNGRLDNRDRS